MTKKKKASNKAPAPVNGKNAEKGQELSEEQLDQVAGGTTSLSTACCTGKHIDAAVLIVR
jgi:hypothetical protein